MKRAVGILVAVTTIAAGCATTSPQGAASNDGYPTAEIASLERAMAGTQDHADLPRLLLARGHAYLLEGERWLKAHPDEAERRKDFERYGGYFLMAINDFQTIVNDHENSPEAPEAMFHLGIAYDYPDLTNFGLAITYYRKTIDRYPGTEWAKRAQQSLDNIQELFHRAREGSHGN